MVIRLRRIVDFMLYSNLFIGCCAGAQVTMIYRLLALPPRWDVVVLVSVSTFVLYSVPQVLNGKTARGNAKLRWTSRSRVLFLAMVGIAMVAMFVLLFGLRAPGMVSFSLAGLIALGYYIPLVGKKGHKEGLRSLYGAKVFYIALVWLLVCLCFPVLVADVTGANIVWSTTIQLALAMFTFITAITIPFDIRDHQIDRRYGLRTLPVLMGVRKSRFLSLALLVIHMLLIATSGYAIVTRLLLLTVSACAVGLVSRATANKHDYFYFLLLDGLLLLQFVAVELGEVFSF